MMDRARLVARLEDLVARAPGDEALAQDLEDLRAFEAKVDAFGFFESGKPVLSEKGRTLLSQFPQAETRYVAWQLELQLTPRKRPLEVRFDWKMVLEDGSIFTEQSLRTILLPEWKTSWHTASWGWEKPGQWKKGTHQAMVTLWGSPLASGSFTIL